MLGARAAEQGRYLVALRDKSYAIYVRDWSLPRFVQTSLWNGGLLKTPEYTCGCEARTDRVAPFMRLEEPNAVS